MSDIETTATVPEARPRSGRQRALNALVFLLAVAVTAQGYLLWEMHKRLDKAFSEIERYGLATEIGAQPMPGMDRHAALLPAPDPVDPNDPQTSAMPFSQPNPNDFDPIREMERMRDEMDRVFGQMQPQDRIAPQVGGVSRTFRTRPYSIDNLDDRYIVKVSLPGVAEADVAVSVQNQVLCIVVKHEQTVQNQPDRHERVTGKSEQRLPLPEPVDSAHLKSSFKDGILSVTIPKLAADLSEKKNPGDPSQSVSDN